MNESVCHHTAHSAMSPDLFYPFARATISRITAGQKVSAKSTIPNVFQNFFIIIIPVFCFLMMQR